MHIRIHVFDRERAAEAESQEVNLEVYNIGSLVDFASRIFPRHPRLAVASGSVAPCD